MKIFKYKFTKFKTALIYAAIALSVLGFGVTVYQIITVGIESAVEPSYVIIQYVLMSLVSILLAVIAISLLKNSYYSVDGTSFVTCFGIIKSSYKIKDITTVELDRNTDKLAVYFENGSYIVIVVSPEWNEDFIDALKNANPEIEFTIKSKSPDEKKDK